MVEIVAHIRQFRHKRILNLREEIHSYVVMDEERYYVCEALVRHDVVLGFKAFNKRHNPFNGEALPQISHQRGDSHERHSYFVCISHCLTQPFVVLLLHFDAAGEILNE